MTNALVVVPQLDSWARLKMLVLESVPSLHTRRLYRFASGEFLDWYRRERWPGLTKATVSGWRASLEGSGLGSSLINVRLSAIRKLGSEATDTGILSPEFAASILRVQRAKSKGAHAVNWLSLPKAQAILAAPYVRTVKGLRDRAIIAVLLGWSETF